MSAGKENGIFIFFRQAGKWIGYGLRFLKKKLLPQGLLYRFILIILLPLLLLQALVLIFFFDRHWDTISRRLASDISGEIGAVADVIDSGRADLNQINMMIDSLNGQLALKLKFDPDGQMPLMPLQKVDSAVQPLMSALKSLGYPVVIQEMDNQQKAIWIQLEEGVLRAVIPRKRFFSSTVDVFLVWMIGFSVLLFWIAFLFMKNQVRSIERLSRAAELFGSGQAVGVFKPEGATEVKQAGVSFLLMQNRIQRYLTERTAMLSGVSHDLRTPLTRMKLQLSMAPQTEGVTDLLSDVTEMEHMLNAYLSFARGEGKEQPESISFNEIIGGMIDKLVKTGQEIDFHQERQVTLVGRPNELSRAVMNLLTNAGRYAKRTRVTLGTYQTMARLVIDDDGPGIPAARRADVFRAFYRMEASRNQHTGGIGLGLTITRDIILSHGGDIVLDDSPMGGLRVIVTLPISSF